MDDMAQQVTTVVVGIVLLAVLVLILLVAVVIAPILWVLGTGGQNPNYGTAEARSLIWYGEYQAHSAGLPTALLAALTAHEGRGNAWAQNYNCSNQQSASKPCSQAFGHGFFSWLSPGPQAHTLSEDAGLMQINSGGWPVPAKASKWQALGMASDPFDPTMNVTAGANELASDFRKYHFLTPALFAYNGGTPANGQAVHPLYASQVEARLQEYLSGPVMQAWALAPYTQKRIGAFGFGMGVGSKYFQLQQYQPKVWVLAVASYPHGFPISLSVAKGQPLITGKDIIQPTAMSVAVGGQNYPMTFSAFQRGQDVPVLPGGEVWGVQLPAQAAVGTDTVTATWIWYVPCGKKQCKVVVSDSASIQIRGA